VIEVEEVLRSPTFRQSPDYLRDSAQSRFSPRTLLGEVMRSGIAAKSDAAADGCRPRPWRRWFRFSVRGQIVAVLIAGAWLGWFIRSVRIQRSSVAGIKKSGGYVIYEWQRQDGGIKPIGEPPVPTWLLDYLGVDYFGNVVSVILYGPGSNSALLYAGMLNHLETLEANDCTVTGPGLSHLKGLSRLHTLALDDIVGDAEWRNLSGLTHLRRVFIQGNNLSSPALAGIGELHHMTKLSLGSSTTNAHLAFISPLTSLGVLVLQDCKITDTGLVHLKTLRRLEELYLDNNAITDAGLSCLTGLTHLKRLSLEGTHLSGEGLAHLRELGRLEELCLDYTDVTDSGVAHLRELTALRWVYLNNTKVTDAGLFELRGLTSLCVLHVRGTRVTDAATKEIQRMLPNVKVDR
jgi:hypothetical protein